MSDTVSLILRRQSAGETKRSSKNNNKLGGRMMARRFSELQSAVQESSAQAGWSAPEEVNLGGHLVHLLYSL